jgi:hypothetical protein
MAGLREVVGLRIGSAMELQIGKDTVAAFRVELTDPVL